MRTITCIFSRCYDMAFLSIIILYIKSITHLSISLHLPNFCVSLRLLHCKMHDCCVIYIKIIICWLSPSGHAMRCSSMRVLISCHKWSLLENGGNKLVHVMLLRLLYLLAYEENALTISQIWNISRMLTIWIPRYTSPSPFPFPPSMLTFLV